MKAIRNIFLFCLCVMLAVPVYGDADLYMVGSAAVTPTGTASYVVRNAKTGHYLRMNGDALTVTADAPQKNSNGLYTDVTYVMTSSDVLEHTGTLQNVNDALPGVIVGNDGEKGEVLLAKSTAVDFLGVAKTTSIQSDVKTTLSYGSTGTDYVMEYDGKLYTVQSSSNDYAQWYFYEVTNHEHSASEYGENGIATCSCGNEAYQPAPQTAADGYCISNLGQLYWFAQNAPTLTDKATLMKDIVINDGTFAADGTFTPTGQEEAATPRQWSPITKISAAFRGNNHKIIGLCITGNHNLENVGFISECISEGVVSGLTLENVYIKANPTQTNESGLSGVGAIVGRYNAGDSPVNCHVTGHVEYSGADLHNVYVGGVAGCISGNISGCSFIGDVKGYHAGGVVGRIINGDITVCRFVGDIIASGERGDNDGYGYFGGIAARCDNNVTETSNILSCYSLANFSLANYREYYGQIFGYTEEKVYFEYVVCLGYKTTGSGSYGSNYCYSLSSRDEEDMTNGHVCYFLNEKGAKELWFQRLGTDGDAMPHTTKTTSPSNVVYYGYANCKAEFKTYGNEYRPSSYSDRPHQYDSEHICTLCGAGDEPALVNGVRQIKTLSELYGWAKYYSGDRAKLMNNITINDGTFAADGTFTPRGASEPATPRQWMNFPQSAGEFDGNNCSIKGLCITGSISAGYSNVGFIGKAEGEVHDLKMENVYISIQPVASTVYLGAIAGYSSMEVKNCNVSGVVEYTTSKTGVVHEVGGLIGRADNAVYFCSFSGSVKGTYYVGGIAGRTLYYVSRCYTSGTVTGRYAGGISGCLGSNKYEIQSSYSTATIVATGDNPKCGGIIGTSNNGGSISRCATTYSQVSGDNSNLSTGSCFTSVSDEQWASGMMCYTLNWDGYSPGWYQLIGTDAKPHLTEVKDEAGNSLNTVYCTWKTCIEKGYANQEVDDDDKPHSYKKGVCTVCGHFKNIFPLYSAADLEKYRAVVGEKNLIKTYNSGSGCKLYNDTMMVYVPEHSLVKYEVRYTYTAQDQDDILKVGSHADITNSSGYVPFIDYGEEAGKITVKGQTVIEDGVFYVAFSDGREKTYESLTDWSVVFEVFNIPDQVDKNTDEDVARVVTGDANKGQFNVVMEPLAATDAGEYTVQLYAKASSGVKRMSFDVKMPKGMLFYDFDAKGCYSPVINGEAFSGTPATSIAVDPDGDYSSATITIGDAEGAAYFKATDDYVRLASIKVRILPQEDFEKVKYYLCDRWNHGYKGVKEAAINNITITKSDLSTFKTTPSYASVFVGNEDLFLNPVVFWPHLTLWGHITVNNLSVLGSNDYFKTMKSDVASVETRHATYSASENLDITDKLLALFNDAIVYSKELDSDEFAWYQRDISGKKWNSVILPFKFYYSASGGDYSLYEVSGMTESGVVVMKELNSGYIDPNTPLFLRNNFPSSSRPIRFQKNVRKGNNWDGKEFSEVLQLYPDEYDHIKEIPGVPNLCMSGIYAPNKVYNKYDQGVYRPGYYYLSGNKFYNDDFITKPYRAYLKTISSNGAKSLSFMIEDENEPTGLRDVTDEFTDAEKNVIFSLGGMKMQNVQKGVNIINGKAVLVK